MHVHLRAGLLSLGRSGDGGWRGGDVGSSRGGGALDVLHPGEISQVPEGLIDRLRHYFLTYNQLPADQGSDARAWSLALTTRGVACGARWLSPYPWASSRPSDRRSRRRGR